MQSAEYHLFILKTAGTVALSAPWQPEPVLLYEMDGAASASPGPDASVCIEFLSRPGPTLSPWNTKMQKLEILLLRNAQAEERDRRAQQALQYMIK